MYADYEYYRDTYYGDVVEEADWPKTEREASAYIDRITYNRLHQGPEIPDAARMAVCAVADVVQRYADAAAAPRGVKSENVDGYTVTFDGAADLATNEAAELDHAAGLYLPRSHPLRYAGVTP